MTAEDRVASLHTKMDARRRIREQRKTAVIGTGCVALVLCLCLCAFSGGGVHCMGQAGTYSGSMMFEGAGGLVLAAVIAFMAGVIVAVFCLKYQNHSNDSKRNEREDGRKSS